MSRAPHIRNVVTRTAQWGRELRGGSSGDSQRTTQKVAVQRGTRVFTLGRCRELPKPRKELAPKENQIYKEMNLGEHLPRPLASTSWDMHAPSQKDDGHLLGGISQGLLLEGDRFSWMTFHSRNHGIDFEHNGSVCASESVPLQIICSSYGPMR